jgi:hypothetical protein
MAIHTTRTIDEGDGKGIKIRREERKQEEKEKEGHNARFNLSTSKVLSASYSPATNTLGTAR